MKDIERRTTTVELRVENSEEKSSRIMGHAALFNTLSEDLGGFREQIAPGAFTEAIMKDDVRALWNHNPDHVLGRNTSGTLVLSEDERGLAIEIIPPDTQFARDLAVSIARGDISQMSFAFSVKQDGQEWKKDDEGVTIRTLTGLRLYDVSPVTYPAYSQTDVAVRSMEKWQEENKPVAPDFTIRRRRIDLLEL